ncbi:hypothetical protein [Pseudomonas sp. 8 R 14]|uniref:hypothetical protein n=1 Tax=Pseudomonas sp. 8 R 14 TaxID=1844092 RepID=UPI00081BD758|nr:hypothetical protein [Pseudomonas sp. 8 R 14]
MAIRRHLLVLTVGKHGSQAFDTGKPDETRRRTLAMTKKKTPSSLLPPIVVPLLEPPVEGDIDGADGGVGLRHSENPLVVYLVNPKVAVTAGSIALLYWGNRNVPVASTPIREGDENLDFIPLTVPASRIVEYWANPVFGKLRRASGNESFTEELKLRVSLSRPGGRDPNDQLPGHQGLVCVIPALILLNGVSEADALIGIKIVIRHWLHMRPYDLIILAWGSQQVLHRVQPGEEGRDITLTVDYATISAAGNNPLTRVAFQVRDAGGNLPDEWARWSAVSLIDVHLNQIRPEAPWLAFPESETGTEIDLGELGSWDVEIEAWITSAEISAYSHVTLIWAGTDSEGNSIPHTPTQVLSAQGLYRFDIPNASVVAIAEGTASVHLLFQKGTVEQPSKKLYLNITGEVFRWPAPTIDEDFGGHINPDIAATVRFPLQASWPGNGYLEVIFRVSSPDNTIEHRVGREVDDIEPTPSGDMLFTVHPNELLRFVGQLVEVFYAHTRPGGRPQESLRMQVIVGQLQRTMPPPIVDKVISGQLNPDDIGAYVKVFAPFTETKRGDWIRMYWIGPHARVEVPVQVAVDGDTTEHDIESFYVTNNLNSTVTAFYTLKRGDEMPRYSKITEVLVSREVGELPPPTLLEAQVTGPGTADLEPLRVQQGTKLVVSYVGMRNIDSIQMTMDGAGDGGSPAIPAKPGNQALEQVEFDITKAAIHANIRNQDTTVKFNYVVTRNGVPKTSGTLTVTVKPIPLAELAKTALKINEANAITKVLDLSTFTEDATAHVGVWPFITLGYPIWLRILGKTAANVTHDRTVFNGAGSSAVNASWLAAGSIERLLPRDYLDGLGHGTELKMEFKAAVSRSKVETQAVTFPVVAYIVNTLPAEFPVPRLTQATGSGTAVTLAPLNARNGATVSVEYTPMYTTDSIEVTMVGSRGAGTPVIAAKPGLTSGVVTFDIPNAAIAANVGAVNKTFTLQYQVIRAGVVSSSKIVTVTVTPIPQADLPRPLINGVAHNGTLDIGAMSANPPLTIAPWPLQVAGKRVWLIFHCEGAQTNPYKPWNGYANPSASGINHYVVLNWLRSCPDGNEIRVEFKVGFDPNAYEAGAVSFPVTSYTANTLPAEFPVPKLTQATGTGTAVTLDPLNAQNGATVSVEYTPMYTTDSIKITMVGSPDAGSPDIAPKPGVTSGVVTFDIPKTAIAANVGTVNKTFTLQYEVTRAGVVHSSKIVTVTVTPIPQANLPRPLINGVAHNRTLDIRAMSANPPLNIAPWPLQVAGNKVWLIFHCEGAQTNPYKVWDGYANPSASGIDHYVLLSWLRSCPDGKEIRVEFKVAFDPNANEAGAVSFPHTIYTASTTPRVESEGFETVPPFLYAKPGYVAVAPTMKVQVRAGNNFSIWPTTEFHNSIAVTAESNGTILSFELNFTCVKVEFWAMRESTVNLLDANRKVILTGSTPTPGWPATPIKHSYSVAGIKFIEFTLRTPRLVVDDFTLTHY